MAICSDQKLHRTSNQLPRSSQVDEIKTQRWGSRRCTDENQTLALGSGRCGEEVGKCCGRSHVCPMPTASGRGIQQPRRSVRWLIVREKRRSTTSLKNIVLGLGTQGGDVARARL